MIPINNSDTAWLIVTDYNQDNDLHYIDLREDIHNPAINQWYYEYKRIGIGFGGIGFVGVGVVDVGVGGYGYGVGCGGVGGGGIGCGGGVGGVVGSSAKFLSALVGGNFGSD